MNKEVKYFMYTKILRENCITSLILLRSIDAQCFKLCSKVFSLVSRLNIHAGVYTPVNMQVYPGDNNVQSINKTCLKNVLRPRFV